VVTSTIVFESGGIREYVGGYDDWLRQRKLAPASAPTRRPSEATGKKATPAAGEAAKRRLSFKERQELDNLPASIEQFETEIAALHDAMAQPDFYQQPGERIAEESARLKSLEERLAAAYERWETLEALQS
jgi:ATP-binding cassette subfamily F protein uup